MPFSEAGLSFDEKLSLLQSMGYNDIMARNALEAADGNVEAAVEIIMADETNQVNNNNNSTAGSSTSRQLPTTPTNTSGTMMNREAESSAMPGGSSFSHEGKTAKEVMDYYSSQMLGEKHPEVRARVKSGCKEVKKAWVSAVAKLKDFDEQNQISVGAKGVIQTCDQKMKSFDEKHQWSKKTNEAANKASVQASKAYDNAKRSLATA